MVEKYLGEEKRSKRMKPNPTFDAMCENCSLAFIGQSGILSPLCLSKSPSYYSTLITDCEVSTINKMGAKKKVKFRVSDKRKTMNDRLLLFKNRTLMKFNLTYSRNFVSFRNCSIVASIT